MSKETEYVYRSFAERSQGYGLTMQQGAKTLKKLGVKLSGISSSMHISLLRQVAFGTFS